MKKIFLYTLFTSILLSACSEIKKSEEHYLIVTTTGMLADAVRNIVPAHVEVKSLMGSGVDPHLYKASSQDLGLLKDADLIVYNGLHLEGKMSDILEKLSQKKKVIAITKGIPKSKLRAMNANTFDPHVWFNVQLWSQGIQYMAQEFEKETTLKDSTPYKTKLYIQKLHRLDSLVKAEVNTLPAHARTLITAHDAFGYFGDAYGMKVIGLQGISTVSDFGLKDISSLVNLIAEQKIKSIFIESSVSPKAIEAVLEGCRDQGHPVQLGATLYSDAMGQDGTFEGTYIGMVTANVHHIVKGLK
jgi:manganese/zinc/iron transport system substrate-binding protein